MTVKISDAVQLFVDDYLAEKVSSRFIRLRSPRRIPYSAATALSRREGSARCQRKREPGLHTVGMYSDER
jgi:hypothetical protein